MTPFRVPTWTDGSAAPAPRMPERTLILLRHAKSDWSGGEADVDRPLAERGVRQAAEAGRWLAGNAPGIDLAVVSPANRARGTWELASAEFDHRPPERIDERLYAASAGRLLEVLRALPDEAATVVLVGHNPGIEDLVSILTGETASMRTSALAVLGLAGSWSTAGQSRATLRAAGRPPAASR
ncbi:SixA phosphatase family protein [Cryobacterium tagatosivorans]|uniref:Histidine phosphatase family protein n=1 Tax=Cryobacterium tagatosivorans TaxID=1259199 RepID=A0A4R8UDL1_9MICO|nr:histidine phosphatase family protein [Cryobacterium tagatosivorans]TFB50387.1 histidine phosphatase family protein [Cryobacterium tagatosivorans]